MGFGEILNMLENAFHNLCFIIDVIVSDNDSTMIYVINNPSRGALRKVLNLSKGKLDD